MGDGCSEHNLPASWAAKSQATGQDIFSEAERYKQMDHEQTAHYELFMASEFGIAPNKKGKSGWDLLASKGKAEKPSIIDDRLYAHPSTILPKKFYDGLDRKLTTWNNGKDKTRASYDKNVAKPVRTVLDAINGIVKESKTIAQINSKLKPYGLNADSVYDARDYLTWLKDGGHLRSQGDAQPLLKTAGHIAKAQANLNIKWTLGNGVDMIRVGSHYLSRPDGIRNTVKGLYEAAQKTGGNPFRRIPSLDKAGVYGSQYIDRGGSNKWNPFEWSITAQKNIVYHLDKAAGGNGHDGIRDTLFDSKPWDRPRYDRFEGSGLVAGLARYGINETRWLMHTSKAAIPKAMGGGGDARSGANLGLYFLGRAAFTGTVSQIPTFIWQAMPKDMQDSIQEFEKKTGQNLIKVGSRSAFKAMGMNAEINLDSYLQPQIPLMGSRAQSLGQTAEGGLKSGAKAVADFGKGKVMAGAANTMAAGLALANFGLLSGVAKGAKWATTLENSPANSTTLTKILSVTGKELENEFNPNKYKLNVTKAVLGQDLVKKPKTGS